MGLVHQTHRDHLNDEVDKLGYLLDAHDFDQAAVQVLEFVAHQILHDLAHFLDQPKVLGAAEGQTLSLGVRCQRSEGLNEY